MRSSVGLVIACLCALLPAAAIAQVTWQVFGTFSDGTTLTGSFSLNQYGFIDYANLTTTGSGPFPGFTYTNLNGADQSAANVVDLEPGPYTDALHLDFTKDLTTASTGKNLLLVGGNSFECQGSYGCYAAQGGDVRYLVGGFAKASAGSGGPSAPSPLVGTGLLSLIAAGVALLVTRPRRKLVPA